VRKGIWYAVAAYTIFGFFPLYWKLLDRVPALQTVSYRILWSCVFLLAFVAGSGRWTSLREAARSRRTVALYAAAALAVSFNWFVYIWAVDAGFVVQTALGYFINPLVSVILGVLLLHERLRRAQWAAVGLAAAGVVYLTIVYRSPPWIALALAASFGAYGLLKKTAPLDALQGLSIETSVLALPALAFLVFENQAGRGAFGHAGPLLTLVMIGAGPVTTVPLLLFAAGARRIPLSLMGMLQYINPSIQFMLGIFVYKEPFTRVQFVGFACVWAALVLFAGEGYVAISSSADHANNSGGSDGPEENRGSTH
jgi:chloramphenicol-sensitive protein RarD